MSTPRSRTLLVCALAGALLSAGPASAADWRAIHRAAADGRLEALSAEIDAGTAPDLPTSDGFTPLYLAVQADRAEAAALLLARGADPAQRHAGWSLLHVAASNDATRAAQVLLQRGADVDGASASGLTPLRVAVLGDRAAMARLLVERGAREATRPVREGPSTPLLVVAAERGHADVVGVLLAAPNHTPGLALEAAVAATAHDRAEALATLLAAGVRAGASAQGSSLLHVAARHDRPRTAELLISRGASLEARDDDSATPLYVAAKDGSNRVAALLLEHRADPNAPNRDGATPLYISAFLGNAPLALALIDHGADVDRRAVDASTTLHLAARQGHVEVARVLLDRGATLDARDFENATPLHRAAREGRAEMVAFLVSRGADPEARTRDGRTPADVAPDEAVRAALGARGQST